jgi:hypothetical protein
MVSTYLTYRMQAQDLNRTMTRVAAEPQVARDAQYFKDNIGKVKSVDDFVNDTRLYNFAMQAYGLQDMSFAKAFMKKVLTSDLTDTSSFANKLSDKRYVQFARAFNFSTSTDGQNLVDIQSDTQAKDTLDLYSAHATRLSDAAQTETTYFTSAMANVHSVDSLLGDSRLRNYALTAAGLSQDTSDSVLRKVLSGDSSAIPATSDPTLARAWQDLAGAFNFQSDGTVAAGNTAQSSSQQSTLTGYYEMRVNNGVTQAGADAATAYYKATIGSVTSVADVVSDQRLSNYIVTAVGLDPANISSTTLARILQSDPNDANSFANTSGISGFKALAKAFNFATDGSLPAGTSAQTSTQINDIANAYNSSYDMAQQSADSSETAYFKAHIDKMTTVDQLVSDHRMFNYLVTAYDLDPSTTPAQLAKSLKVNPTDPSAKLTGTATTGLKALVTDFNFDANGNIGAQRQVQSYKNIFATISAYTSSYSGDTKADSATIKTDSTYFQTTIPKIQSLNDLVADKKITAYLAQAYNLPANMRTPDAIKQILTSDVSDPKSLVNQAGNENMRTMAAAFNFDTKGAVMAQATSQAQFAKDTPVTSQLYMQQQLEQEVGNDSEGARLALYFKRVGPTIKSPYDILSDKALLQVVQTALGLPASGQADIDAQAKQITQKLNLADLQDPKKLDQFIVRFSALYDVANQSAQQDPIVSLLSGSSSDQSGFSMDLLSSLQNFKSAG